jgi:hypothetical protein
MSWDIVVFSTDQKISSVEGIDESFFRPTNFDTALHQHFSAIVHSGNHREISGIDFTIDYFAHDELTSNIIFNLYGENALYALIQVAKVENWQIFDTGNGEMIDLENPEKNGYRAFQLYLQQVKSQSS